MSLSKYHKKRNFSQTPEPKGQAVNDKSHLFIIQKHAASHLHYDFRIELQGVLKSWAIPKGPSLDPHVKRLAMHVEDHPIEYGTFEGIIPQGQYGGGTVMLWDKGIWEPLDQNPYKAYEQGHLRFNLHAEKLNGRWDLLRFKGENQWFLIKHQDEFARSEDDYNILDLNKSVASRQTIDEIAKKNSAPPKSPFAIHLLPEHLTPSSFPSVIEPELATLVDKAPASDEWLHEIKFDGYRILAFKQKNQVTLKTRNNQDWSDHFVSVAETIKQLPVDNLIIDGEIVILDKEGRSNFQQLQNSFKNQANALFVYFVFDILYYDAFDLRNLPLIERKAILKNVLADNLPTLRYSDHIICEGPELFEHSCAFALEGIISKRLNSIYLSKRTKDWLKIKCIKRQEFVIGGYSKPQGKREYFGSLFLGVFNQKGELEYVGNVGTGFNKISLKDIHNRLIKNKISTSPFTITPPNSSQAIWVHPLLVGEVEFTEWTAEGHLRHPTFKGLRLDKKATAVTREKEIHLHELRPNALKSKQQKPKIKIALSNPKKILYPEDGITKEELFHFYDEISEYALPFISLRPLTLVRCPANYKHCFYQRHDNAAISEIKTDESKSQNGEHFIYVHDKKELLNLVQMDTLEIHPWGSTITHLENPDILVIDLDPAPDVPWSRVVTAALEVRDQLAQYQLKSFVKSTGGKGLHVVIPIKPEYEWDTVNEFTHVFVRFLEQLKPDKYVSTMSKSKRSGKIFVDYLRNQRTATSIGAYSTRAKIHAPVSTPLAWEELSPNKEENTYTIRTLPKRLQQLHNDPWADFWNIKQSLRLDDL